MATSPIYGWAEPDNTDLVKNGALAIRTLGNAIDTTMGTMTPKSTFTAKGSIAAATAASTPANLAVGNNGETLVADSSTSTGLRYQANYAAGKNKIINGDYSNWQRSTSTAMNADGAYLAPDRYLSYFAAGGATVTWSRQTFTPGTAPVAGYEGTFFNRISGTSGGASTEIGCGQKIEDVRTFAGQTATFSFYAKADSARTGNILVLQNFGSGGSAGVTVSSTSFSLTTSWTRFTFTLSIPSISGKTVGTSSYLSVYANLVTGNATGSPVLDSWGWQLEAGSVATAFQTATGTIQGELAACQRYYYRAVGGNNNSAYAMGSATSTTVVNFIVPLPVTFRTLTSATIDTGNLCISDGVTAATGGTFTSSGVLSSQNIGFVIYTHGSAALTQYRPYRIENNSNNTGYIGFSAEL